MTLTDHVLHGSTMTVDRTGGQVDIGLPWYRSLPFSAITGIEVTVDGETFDASRLAVDLDGTLVGADQLPDRYWFLQDRLPVVLPGWTPRPDAVSATVSVHMRLALPYMFAAPEVPITVTMAAAGDCPIRR